MSNNRVEEARRLLTSEPFASSDEARLIEALTRTLVTVVSGAAVWCALAMLIRSRLVFMHADLNLMLPLRMVGVTYYELVIAIPLALVFVVASYVTRRSVQGLAVIRVSWWILSTSMVLIDAVNVVVLKYLGTPFSYQWLYYSDFLQSFEARNALLDSLSWSMLGAAIVVIAVSVVGTTFLRVILLRFVQPRQLSTLSAACVIVIIGSISLPVAKLQLDHNRWAYSRIANPVIAFIESFATGEAPPIFTMPVPEAAQDYEVARARQSGGAPHVTAMTGKAREVGIRNVLVFVFESTPAEYVDPYGGIYHVTPELDKYRSSSVLFRNAYAHAPMTNVSLVSILTGTYPWISTEFVTQAYPRIFLHSLSQELEDRGARTAFFNSADLRFKGADKFLEHRFDVVTDGRTIVCDKPVNLAGSEDTLLTRAWKGSGVDDACSADALTNWIAKRPDQPFFGMLWTMMTHFPYFSSGSEIDYGVGDDKFNRYLNALHADDAAFGRIMRRLDDMGLLDATLVIALGDHGEAFGRHGQYVHASKINEENVHIPLLLINRRLFSGQESTVIAGMADLAPTVMDLLDLALPGDWQGRSLFAEDRSPRTYFFAPWADLLFGYREGDRKFIFNATTNQFEVYDLLRDPNEMRNLINEMPGVQKIILQRMAAWVQYQNRMISRQTSQSVTATSGLVPARTTATPLLENGLSH
jgi:lipoteichoic acid synthase